MSAVPHAITSLTLENFRNYRSLSLALPPGPVVLRGHNGAGKTNILEAISLLAPGRGFRHAKLREMDALAGSGAPWVVAATITTNGEPTQIGTARDGESTSEKRIIKVNGEKLRGHGALTQHVCIQWLTPAMDQVFTEGGSARRKLLDRIVYGFDTEHAARVTAYESAMRERNRLLADGVRMADPHWLSVLEQQMAEHGVAITLARQQAIARLQQLLATESGPFPRAEMALTGAVESWLGEGASALEAETQFTERLAINRLADARRGRATLGSHKSQFEVIHNLKNMPAERCSTGEQKALLLSITLSAARARAEWCGLPPILLLDEVIAHLDVDKRAALFDLIRAHAIQAWMTGTDAADFKGLEGFATSLEITGGTARVGVEN